MLYQALCWLHCSEVYKPEQRLSKSLSWLTTKAYIFRRLGIFDWDFCVTAYTKTLGTTDRHLLITWISVFNIYLHSLWFKYPLHFDKIKRWWNKWVNKLVFYVLFCFLNRLWHIFIKAEVVWTFLVIREMQITSYPLGWLKSRRQQQVLLKVWKNWNPYTLLMGL